MKLNDLTPKEIIWEETIQDQDFVFYAETIEEGVKQINFGNQRGGAMKTAGDVLGKINPTLAGIAAGMAINSLIKYKQNRKYTTRFFAKDRTERRFYEKLVADLMKSGHYVKVREKYMAGGYVWELRRKDIR